MAEYRPSSELPPISAKRYFTIGEVAELCEVKPHVLRYWEQEFSQLKPVKRRGNRRYYQHHEVLLIRRIRELLYGHGFTINGARLRLDGVELSAAESVAESAPPIQSGTHINTDSGIDYQLVRQEILAILSLLAPSSAA
ncbi:MAG: MerR family transcriptional regulator [Betaproteobacteria bacterium]|nr:MerR family transcriptional regulator [Betaproteobacteria bacterium]